MLHAYFCSPDKAIKKHRLEALKIHGYRIPRVSKSIQKAASKRYCSGEGLRTSIFLKNCDFSIIFGIPKRSQNRRKNAENAMLKNNTFFNRFLLEFSSLWPPKIEPKFDVFQIFMEKADFVKIVVSP